MADRIIINSIEIENLGRIKKLSCNSLSGINLIIGENGCGKTFLLKALYSAIRTTEEYKRGDDIRNANDILAEKLRWTFQTDKLGDIVTKSGTSPYIFKMPIDIVGDCGYNIVIEQKGAEIMQIYADNAATTKMSEAAIKTMTEYMQTWYGNPSSLYRIGQRAKEKLEEARFEIAKVINAEPREIIFTSGGSESDNQALLTAAVNGRKKGKMHIVSSAFEHHAILHTLKKLEKNGFEITLLPVHENGIVRTDELEAAIREDTCLVTIMTANNEIGTIQPISEIGEICRKHNVVFHTDAVQAVGHIPIDVKAQNIDMLSASAHKFHGPKGVGFLYVRKGIILQNLIEGGAQERGKRAGTENLPGIAAMAVALKESAAGMENNNARMAEIRDYLIQGLSEIPHSALNGDAKQRLAGNVNFSFEGIEGESILILLDQRGISASSGSACTSGALDPSHVLLAIGRIHDVAHGSLRLSIGENITKEEADYIIACVKEVVAHLRSFSPVWRDLTEGKKEFILK